MRRRKGRVKTKLCDRKLKTGKIETIEGKERERELKRGTRERQIKK